MNSLSSFWSWLINKTNTWSLISEMSITRGGGSGRVTWVMFIQLYMLSCYTSFKVRSDIWISSILGNVFNRFSLDYFWRTSALHKKKTHRRWLTVHSVVMLKCCALLLLSANWEKTNPMNAEVTLNICPAIWSDVSSTGLAIYDSRLTGWLHAAPLLTVGVINSHYNQETCNTAAMWRSSTWRNPSFFSFILPWYIS